MLDPTAVPGLLGPLGLLIGSLIVVMVLWRLVQDYIKELQTSRDRWRDLAVSYEAKFDEQTEVLRLLPTIGATLERMDRRLETLR
jgi:hypothetical protein